MPRYCLTNQSIYFIDSVSRRNASRQIRHVSRVTVVALFDYYQVCIVGDPQRNPACLRMLFQVPRGRSLLILPAMVTVPSLVLCR